MIGYLDIPSGISGDMFLGCLVDAGWPVDELRSTLQRLNLPAQSWSVEAKSVMKGALRATLVDVKVAEGGGHFQPVAAGGLLTALHHHDHTHRNLHDIRAIINAADLPSAVKERAIAVFTRLAHAEARVHGSTLEQVHFHEVGALDAIVDIVGAVAGVHAIGMGQLYASAVPLGHGWVNTAHGKLPLPAPATLEILSAAKAPTRPAPGEGELVTPTGAALIAELARFEQPPMRFERMGLGAGQKDLAWPNMARLWLGTALEKTDATPHGAPFVQVETNIDDMNPQLYAPVMEKLFAAGARDVWLTPIQMKKGRPGVMLSVLADAQHERAMADIVLSETTTLGVRVHPVHRHEARREMGTVETAFGPISVKLKWLGDKLCGAMPEYEDCAKVARERNVPVKSVYDAAIAAAREAFALG